jgi:hypothetical protein
LRALAQQTATSEILRVIASSPTDIQPVLEKLFGELNKKQSEYADDIGLGDLGQPSTTLASRFYRR